MKVGDINTTLIEGYIKLLDHLSPDNKLSLISRLTDSIKSDLEVKKDSFSKSFGAFHSSMNAAQIISDIKASRTFTRKIDEL